MDGQAAQDKQDGYPTRQVHIQYWYVMARFVSARMSLVSHKTFPLVVLVIHAWAKSGGTEAAMKAQQLLDHMHKMYREGNVLAKPDTITVSYQLSSSWTIHVWNLTYAISK